MSDCKPVVDIKKYLPTNFAHTLFLEHTSDHSGSISVFIDGSKSDTGVGFAVVFPDSCRGGSLPVLGSVFTAELSIIILALQIIFTFPVIHFTIFRDSRSALSGLSSYNLSGNPLVLSTLEWLYLLYKRGYRVDLLLLFYIAGFWDMSACLAVIFWQLIFLIFLIFLLGKRLLKVLFLALSRIRMFSQQFARLERSWCYL